MERDGAPLRAGLQATAEELDGIAALGLRLQDQLSAVLAAAGPAAAESAQSLDLLVQQAQGAAEWLRGLAAGCDPSWRADLHGAGATLRLASQRERLTLAEAAQPLAPSRSGELELF